MSDSSTQELPIAHLLPKAPKTTLQNGIHIINFSSPHSFLFTDGSVLGKCDPARVEAGALDVEEIVSDGIKGTQDIEIKWHLNEKVIDMLDWEHRGPHADGVDIVLVPLPVILAVKEAGYKVFPKIRACRIANRMTKVIFADKFCV